MQLFYVKKDLFGLRAGRVERFAPHKAGAYLVEGMIEPYDEKKHANAPGSPPYEKKKQEDREMAEMEAEEERQRAGAPKKGAAGKR